MKIKQVIDFVEEYSKPGFNAMWSFVINVVRPFSAGMGLRISQLGPLSVEIVIPYWLRNQDEGPLHEATYLTAAKEGQRLWLQRLLGLGVHFEVMSYQLRLIQPIIGEARAQFSFEPHEVEIFLREIRQKQILEPTFFWQLQDSSEKKCAEIEMQLKITVPQQIPEKSSSKKREN